MSRCKVKLLLFAICYLLFAGAVFAAEYSSDSFKILDPSLNESSAILNSTSYQLISTIGELASGYSTGTNYIIDARSTAYPGATAPVLSATGGVAHASLSWTASQGVLGWTVSGYDVCTGTVSNVYTCENVGNVTTFNKTNLTVGTAYFFRVRAKDAFSNVVARSNEATATPVAAGPSPPPGGSGDTPTPPPIAVRDVTMSGRAYSGATVSLLRDGSVATTVVANQQGTFSGTISAVAAGIYNFGAIARDAQQRSSIMLTYTVNVPSASIGMTIENIFLPPTVQISAASLVQGEILTINGTTFPQSAVIIHNSNNVDYTTSANSQGAWSYGLNTAGLSAGEYTIRVKSRVGIDESDYGAPQSFTIASLPVIEVPAPTCRGSDVNNDNRINLADISILLTFWNQASFSNRCADINSDGQVSLVDFSILLFNWTG